MFMCVTALVLLDVLEMELPDIADAAVLLEWSTARDRVCLRVGPRPLGFFRLTGGSREAFSPNPIFSFAISPNTLGCLYGYSGTCSD